MIHITESESAKAVSHELAFAAVRAALIAVTADETMTFPVVLGNASHGENRFTIKSATDKRLTGLKVGSYFPTNDVAGLPRHNSIILLFDQARGRIGAIVEGGALNAYRTAAADAVATDALARADAEVLALFGTGHQAEYEATAIARIRSLRQLLVVGRDQGRCEAFVARLRQKGLPAQSADAESACRAAEIIVTATTSVAPLFHAEWVRPGTHISTMGSDATDKQELPPELFERSRLFCDLPEQSRRIGEFQHLRGDVALTAIGEVLTGKASGRINPEEITIFDSSGLAVQDLYMADAIIRAIQASLARA